MASLVHDGISKEADPASATLEASAISKAYGKREVVSQVDITVPRGSVIGLLGPNGAGKTTSFYMMVGLVFPSAGKIFLKGQEVTQLPLHERSQRGVAYLPQESSLFRKLSVYDNIAMALEAKGYEGSELDARCEALMKRFGLLRLAKSVAATLSGGERRRCEIARCLAIEPEFLLLDEPFAGIDPIAVSEIQGFIAELRSQNIGVLITDHNVRETLGTCDVGYLMRDGRIFFSGSPEEISNNEEARKFYLGESFRLN
jgi:lipopolysaccharide export system ATP-binding protein